MKLAVLSETVQTGRTRDAQTQATGSLLCSDIIMLPTLFRVLGHIGFCFLLLDKWESLELANDGQTRARRAEQR